MDWREGGVRIRSQYLLKEAEDGRRDVAEVEEEAEQRHGRRGASEREANLPCVCVRVRGFEILNEAETSERQI